MKKKKRLNRSRTTGFDIVLYIVFGIFGLITLFPFYNVIIVSLSNTVASAKHVPYLLPYVFDLTGYKTIMQDKNFVNALGVSLFVTIVGVVINLFLSVTGAYALSKKNLPGRKFMLGMILFTMLFSGGLVPTYMIIKQYGLVNSIWSMIIPTAISTYYLIIMKNYFLNLPQGLLEAAYLDGANEWQVLWKIVIPISKPFLATFALFYCVERWNEWYNAMLYISKQALRPLQIYLREILINMNSQLSAQAQQMIAGTMKASSTAIQMAAIIITTVPIMLVYPYLQKYFVNGVMVGGLKE